jgi:Restriction endonuclease
VDDDDTIRELTRLYGEPLALGKIADAVQSFESSDTMKMLLDANRMLKESAALKALFDYGKVFNGSPAVKAMFDASKLFKESAGMKSLLETGNAFRESQQMKEMVQGLQLASAVAAQLDVERLFDPTGSLRKMRERDRELGKLVNVALHGRLRGIHASHFDSNVWKRALGNELRTQLVGDVFVGKALDPELVPQVEPETEAQTQLTVPTNAVIQYVCAGAELTKAILADPQQVARLLPKEMVEFVCDRFTAMGLNVEIPRPSIFQSDGGIDVFFWPRSGLKYVGIAQIKARQNNKKEGPGEVQKLGGVLTSHRSFDFGYFISNREFTADAIHYAQRIGLRLRGPKELAYWAVNNADDAGEYQHLPERLELTSTLTLPLRKIVTGKR